MSQDEVRKGMVSALGPGNTMAVDYDDGGASPPVPRFMFGGLRSGLHVGGAQFDQVAVLRWGQGRKPIGVVPVTDHPDRLDPLAESEVYLYGPDGTPMLVSTAATPMALQRNGASVTIDPAGKIVIEGAGGSMVTLSVDGGGHGTVLVSAAPGGVSIANNTSVTGTLGISGAETVGGALGVSGTSTLAGVTATSVSSSGTVSGTAISGSSVTATGAGSFGSMTVSGSVSLGVTTFTGAVNAGNFNLTNVNTLSVNNGVFALTYNPSSGNRFPLGGVAVQTTAPSAGGAGALPATPAGYLFISISGVSRVVPYY